MPREAGGSWKNLGSRKLADTALPKASNTTGYVEFRKMEVYKAVLESALEGGEITPKERGTLSRLGAKLGIAERDAGALEVDVRERLAST